MRNHYKINCFD